MAEVAGAGRLLSRLGLVSAFGHVSARTAKGFVITPGTDLALADADRLVEVAGEIGDSPDGRLPAGAPAEAWLHLALYRSRSDVAAIARGQPPAAFAASAAGRALHPLYGQACWLGETLPVYDDARLLRTRELAVAAASALPGGEAMLLRGNGAVTTGDSPSLAVARMWLVQAVCAAWTSCPPSERRGLSAAEIASWRAVASELLPRLAGHLIRTTRT